MFRIFGNFIQISFKRDIGIYSKGCILNGAQTFP